MKNPYHCFVCRLFNSHSFNLPTMRTLVKHGLFVSMFWYLLLALQLTVNVLQASATSITPVTTTTTTTNNSCTRLDSRFTRPCQCNQSSSLGVSLNCTSPTFQQLQLISRITDAVPVEAFILIHPPPIPNHRLLFANRTAPLYNLTIVLPNASNHTGNAASSSTSTRIPNLTKAEEEIATTLSTWLNNDLLLPLNLSSLHLHAQLTQLPEFILPALENATTLDLSSNRIDQLQPKLLKNLTQLSALNLDHNQLTKIPADAFAGLSQMRNLTLSRNQISTVASGAFRGTKKLSLLDLSYNQLDKLDRTLLSDLTELQTLNLSGNSIRALPRQFFQRTSQLRTLDISHNQLAEFDTFILKGVRYIRQLFLAYNQIASLAKNAFTTSTRLRTIDLTGNRLQTIVADQFVNMQYMDRILLSRNQIETINSGAFQRLFQVDIELSHNLLKTLPRRLFMQCTNISLLDLRFNRLQSLPDNVLDESDVHLLLLQDNQLSNGSLIGLSNYTSLTVANFSNNLLTKLGRRSLIWSGAKLYELHTIDLSSNRLTQLANTIFEHFPSLRYLFLQNNRLKRLSSSSFGAVPALLELHLQHNQLVDVAHGTLTQLMSLRILNLNHNRLPRLTGIPIGLSELLLSHNQFETLAQGSFPEINALLYLDLTHNQLTSIEGEALISLKTLRSLLLGSNLFEQVPDYALRHLVSCQLIDLRNNSLSRLRSRQFGQLPVVFELDLRDNQIVQLDANTFGGLLQLQTLLLDSNRLRDLHPEAFNGLVSLTHLSLANNSLSSLANHTHSALDPLLSIHTLNLSYNQLTFIRAGTFPRSPYIPYKLRILDLSHNNIPLLDKASADGWTQLQQLNLSHNLLGELRPSMLTNLTQLQLLQLNANQLHTIPNGSFDGLLSLRSLNLSDNQLSQLPDEELRTLIAKHALRDLYLAGNPLNESLLRDKLFESRNRKYRFRYALASGGASTVSLCLPEHHQLLLRLLLIASCSLVCSSLLSMKIGLRTSFLNGF